MAIQIPNPGTGNGATGDNEFVLWSKVKDNFSNTAHAASRLVGEASGNVMQVGAFGLGSAVATTQAVTEAEYIAQLKAKGSHFFRSGMDTPLMYKHSAGIFARTHSTFGGITFSYNGAGVRCFSGDDAQAPTVVAYDLYHTKSTEIYTTTTASGANVVVDSTGKLMRSTSSERYKDIIADLELDDELYANAMQLAPIVYRSTADADNPAHHYYSFSAEALGAHDKAFTLWRDTETVTDEDGNTTEQPLDKPVAEGINLNAIVAFLHATNVKQGKLIDELSARIGVLEDADK